MLFLPLSPCISRAISPSRLLSLAPSLSLSLSLSLSSHRFSQRRTAIASESSDKEERSRATATLLQPFLVVLPPLFFDFSLTLFSLTLYDFVPADSIGGGRRVHACHRRKGAGAGSQQFFMGEEPGHSNFSCVIFCFLYRFYQRRMVSACVSSAEGGRSRANSRTPTAFAS